MTTQNALDKEAADLIHRTHADAGLCAGDPEALRICKQQQAARAFMALCLSREARRRVQRAQLVRR